MVRGGALFPGTKELPRWCHREAARASLSQSITLVINPHVKHSLGPGCRPCSCFHVFVCLINDSAGRGVKGVCGKWFWARFFKTFLHIPIHFEAALGLGNENVHSTRKTFGLESGSLYCLLTGNWRGRACSQSCWTHLFHCTWRGWGAGLVQTGEGAAWGWLVLVPALGPLGPLLAFLPAQLTQMEHCYYALPALSPLNVHTSPRSLRLFTDKETEAQVAEPEFGSRCSLTYIPCVPF